jgi:hypothetical protein
VYVCAPVVSLDGSVSMRMFVYVRVSDIVNVAVPTIRNRITLFTFCISFGHTHTKTY